MINLKLLNSILVLFLTLLVFAYGNDYTQEEEFVNKFAYQAIEILSDEITRMTRLSFH